MAGYKEEGMIHFLCRLVWVRRKKNLKKKVIHYMLTNYPNVVYPSVRKPIRFIVGSLNSQMIAKGS